jgi:hypothetical protein
MSDEDDIEYEVPELPPEVFETEDKEEPKEPAEGEEKAIIKYPKLDAFLMKWDKSLALDRRCFGIRLCFAGADGKEDRDGMYRIGVRYILISYFYSRKWLKRMTVQEIAEDLGRFDFVFLDSGGFSFIQAIKNGKDLGIDLESYTAEYYQELERIGHLFAGCAELDIHERFTQYQMEEFKDKLLDKNIPIVPVIQPENAKVEVIKELGWFDKYAYIAFGSALIGNPAHTGDMLAINDYGRDHGNLFHGFGVTSAEVLLRSKFFSVDSTTWKGGSRFGNTMIFQNGRIKYYDHKHKEVRKRFKQRLEESGIIWKDVEEDKRREVDLMNALAWKQWADSIRFNIQNSYWLTPEERDLALSLKSKAFNAEGLIDRTKSLARAEARRITQSSDASYDDRSMEVLNCDTCYLNGRCPRYKHGEACGYDTNVRLETMGDLHKAAQVIMEVEFNRVMTGVLFEKAQGGVLDANVSNEMQKFLTMMQQIKVLFQPNSKEEIIIQAKSNQVGSIGKMLAAVFAPSGSSGSGSGNTKTERAANKIINVTPVKDKKNFLDDTTLDSE